MRTAFISLSLLAVLLTSVLPASAEETPTPCEDKKGKELFFCWKGKERKISREEHERFHRKAQTEHAAWHRANNDLTGESARVAHDAFHRNAEQEHKAFHRATQDVRVERKEAVKKDKEETQKIRRGGISQKRSLRPREKKSYKRGEGE